MSLTTYLKHIPVVRIFQKPSFMLILVMPVFLSGCLSLDLGTILSLKRMDPYSLDLINSRAAFYLPSELVPGEHINLSLKIKQAGRTIAEEKFALEVIESGEDLAGIKFPNPYGKSYVIRLSKDDAIRAKAVQSRLGALDKNHKWIEPEEDTIGLEDSETPKQAATLDSLSDNSDAPVNGDISVSWNIRPTAEARQQVCAKPKNYKFWAWVKVNQDPAYRRVVHGLSLKRLFGKEGMKNMCKSTKS